MTTTDSRPAIPRTQPNQGSPGGPNSRAAEEQPAPVSSALREPNSHATVMMPMPDIDPSRGPTSRPAIDGAMPWNIPPVGSDSRAAVCTSDPDPRAPRETSDRPARTMTPPQSGSRDGSNAGRDRAAGAASLTDKATLFDPALALAADFLDDIERVKLANENRLRALTRVGTDADGVDRYIGLPADHPVVEQLATMVESLATIEHAATLNLQRMVRKHPLGPWIKATKGVGEKQGARLLASIGDPYWRPEITREDGTVIPEGPRTVSALWAYCGLHVLPGGQSADDNLRAVAAGDLSGAGGDSGQRDLDAHIARAGVAARRRKGVQANWSTKAKTRAYLIAEASLKTKRAQCEAGYDEDGRYHALHLDECVCSPYRLVYDRRKSHTSVSRPDWTDGHRHADALRVASKEVLKDLWRAGREWHHEHGQEVTS